jgi:DNA segregation ATPase FtsK/SpoIIIE, S-DNA-T family
MPKRPTWRLDLLAFALFLIGLLVALSAFSHDPDLPANLLGPIGARVGRLLHSRLGIALYPLLAGWFVLVLMLFVRRHFGSWSRRLAGWLLLVPGSALAAHYLGVSEGGGALGAALADWLEARVVPLGRVLFIVAILALGGMLAFGFVLKAALRRLWCASRWIGQRCCAPFQRQRPPVEPAATQPLPWYRRFRRRQPPVMPQPEPVAASEPSADGDPLIPIRHADSAPAQGEGRPDPASLPVVRPGPAPEEDRFADFQLPPLTLLDDPQPFPHQEHDQHLRDRAALLEKTFKDFDLNVRVVGINTGPVITQYEVALETGLRVHKVTSLVDDLALNLGVPSIRMLAPIPGKNTVGVEIPNEHRAVVRLKEVILASGKKVAKTRLPLFLGKDSEGRPLLQDLADMPHLLIAGTTGTGKSVCMNSIILSLLMTRRPDEVKMIMIDPKMLEMDAYGRVPHLMHPVVTQMEKAEAILSWAVDKMDERYDLLKRARVRNLAGYNELSPEEIHRRLAPADEEERNHIPDRMPYIVIFIDEFADLIMRMRKEIEGHIIRLAQKSRAAGIHLVLATQKPTVDVITGLIKSNLPARICFKVASRTDSRVVLDEMGADKLLGRGDMLFLQPGTSNLIRAQGTYASDEEITRVVDNLECEPCYDQELVQLKSARSKGNLIENLRERDELYEQAIEVLVREGRGSVSLLQRALGIGYGRAARLIDFMAEDGIVGDFNGSQAREVLYTPEQWDLLKQNGRRAS